MHLTCGVAHVWLSVSLGFHSPAPWKLICTCTKVHAQCIRWMLLLQSAKQRLGLNSRRYVGHLWGQQSQIAAGSKIQQVPVWCYLSSCDTPVLVFMSIECQLVLVASPCTTSTCCHRCYPSRSCANAGARRADPLLHERNAKLCPHDQGRARSTAPPAHVQPTPLGSIHLPFPSSSF